MAHRKRNTSHITVLAFTLIIGLVMAVAGYVTYKGGLFELRSKAASKEIILKQWTFNKSKEGWKAVGFVKSGVSSGIYSLVINTKEYLRPRITHESVNVLLRYPVNTFRLRVSVTTPLNALPRPTCVLPPRCANNNPPCVYQKPGVFYCPLETGGRESVAQKKPFLPSELSYVPVSVLYRLQDSKSFSELPSVRMLADGRMRSYNFTFPKETYRKRINEIQVVFADSRTPISASMNIDTISVAGFSQAWALPPVSPGNGSDDWCPGPNGTSCSFTTCAGYDCDPGVGACPAQPMTCTPHKGICKNNQCVELESPR